MINTNIIQQISDTVNLFTRRHGVPNTIIMNRSVWRMVQAQAGIATIQKSSTPKIFGMDIHISDNILTFKVGIMEVL